MFKNEEGFSLLELSIAAGVAVALAAVAVTATSTVSDGIKDNANNGASDASVAIDTAAGAGADYDTF